MPWTATVLVFLRDQKGSIYPAAGAAVQPDRKVIRRLENSARRSHQDFRYCLRRQRPVLANDARDQARHLEEIVGGGEHPREPAWQMTNDAPDAAADRERRADLGLQFRRYGDA